MKKMPVVFVGHGTPLNAIEDNEFTNYWKSISKKFNKPKAILSISAHWVTNNGSFIQKEKEPRQIYDFYGFPKRLYDVKYPAKGNMDISEKIINILDLEIDNNWGIDHGSWSVLSRIYEDADIPVIQLSIDFNKSFKEHFECAKKLEFLRDEGVLIFCSGNIVHNLALLDSSIVGITNVAKVFDDFIEEKIIDNKLEEIISLPENEEFRDVFYYSVPTSEHFVPLLYAIACKDSQDKIEVFNKGGVMGSITMTGYIFG